MNTMLLAIVAMVFIPWLVAKVTKLDRVIPLPMMQIAFGILLGPSAFGSNWPELWSVIFTQPVRVGLDAIQLLAITIFAFIAGIELKPKEVIAEQGNSIWSQALKVILIPIVIASVSFMLLFDNGIWHDPGVSFFTFAWCMGVATCITALPMLVVSCQNLGIYGTANYRKLLALVTFDDLILWLTIAVIISFEKYAISSAIFFAVFAILYYAWPKLLHRVEESSWPTLTVTLALGMATFSHWAGLHYVLGAFFAGMITPRHTAQWNKGMESQQMVWLMPVFFIWTGLKTSWDLDLSTILLGSAVMFVIALSTKFIGVWFAYRDQGIRIVCFKTALLQTKGLMEIFLATVLLTAGIINSNMFAAVVIMSLISTVVAVPLARLFYKPEIDNK
jgi:Kef-type K+ transport system membrane component KefB